jgi:transmembrane sensor
VMCVIIVRTMNPENQNIDPRGLLPKVFSGEASPDEKKQVDDWLAADPANQAEYNAIARLWSLTGEVKELDELDIDLEWRKMESAITRTKTLYLARFLQIAASIILISVLALTGLKISRGITETAPSAKPSSVVLPDGTALSLNAGSKATYKKGFGKTHRTISLRGEAYFEVKRNDPLPFIVEAGKSRIRVTGTKFNVNAYHKRDEIMVVVTSGAVRLYDVGQPNKGETLFAGETGTFFSAERQVTKQPAMNLNDLAWKTRIMDFQNTALSEVARVLMNTYHVKIEIDPAVQHCPVTVHFENQELNAVLAVLKSTLSLELINKGRYIAISGKGC